MKKVFALESVNDHIIPLVASSFANDCWEVR